MFKIDKTLVNNMNMNRSFIVITHKETVMEIKPKHEAMTLEDDKQLPEEIREKAQEYVESANLKAAQIISGANAQAEEIKELARQEGLAQGVADGAAQLKAQLRARIEELGGALDQIEAYRTGLFDALNRQVLELSLGIAEKIINFTLDKDDRAYRELVKNAVENLKKSDDFTLSVSRADYERFFKESTQWLSEQTGCGLFQVEGDPHMKKGDCVIETDNEILDAGVSMQLKKIHQYLNEQVE